MFSGVLLSFPAPKYEYSLHRQSSLNSSGTNRCVNRTPKCPGLWLWCFSLCNSPNDSLCATGMSEKVSGAAGGAAGGAACC